MLLGMLEETGLLRDFSNRTSSSKNIVPIVSKDTAHMGLLDIVITGACPKNKRIVEQ